VQMAVQAAPPSALGVEGETWVGGWVALSRSPFALQPCGAGSVPTVLIDGYDPNLDESTVLLATANPIKVATGCMKRNHSIAQGKPPNSFRHTSSSVSYASFSQGGLRNGAGSWSTWTGDITSEQAAYPWPSPHVQSTVLAGCEYFQETNISLDTY